MANAFLNGTVRAPLLLPFLPVFLVLWFIQDAKLRGKSPLLISLAVAILLFPLCSLSVTHSGFPVDIVAGPSPQPVMADGRCHLVYKLHLTNFAPLPIELTRIDVLGDGTSALAIYRGPMLENVVIPVEKLSSPESPSQSGAMRAIGDGHAVMIFLDLTLDSGVRPSAELHHRFSLSVTLKTGATIERTLDGPIVTVVRDPAPVLRAPLGGSVWVAFNALGAEDHRRSLNAVDGRERIPQRFAIDWMRLGPDGRLFRGDGKANASFYGCGTEVLAVGEGRISDLKDGLADNVGSTERGARDITLDNAFGNYLTVDRGLGRFAVYTHLQPGSLRVKLGDTVKAGPSPSAPG